MELGLGTIIYLIYVGLLLLGIVPAGLIWYAKYWNGTKFIKAQLAKTPIDTFGGVFNKWKEFTFQEDDERFLPKLQGKFFDTILSPKGFIFLNIGISLILLIIPIFFPAETWFLGILWLLPSFIAYRKTYNRFREIEGAREAQIRRMYDVANAALKFDPMTAYMPASVVNVTKWKNRTIPQSVVIIYPTNFRADQPQAQENFERLFNTAITDENAWIYTWHPTKNAIQCRPVEDLPKMVEYKGAGPFGWHTFPLGVGLGPKGQEIVSYSVNRNEKTNMYFPHVLVAGTTGSGKMASLDTPVKTPYGTRILGDLKAGDEVFDNDGNVVKVTHLHPIITPEKAYKVVFSDGEEITVDPEHLWFTETRASRVSDSIQRRKKRDGSKQDIMLFNEAMLNKIENEIKKSSPLDTISIPEIAAFVEKEPTAKYFYNIAKIIGVAEEVHPIYKQHYNAQIVRQKQSLTFVNSQEFMDVYNSYKFRRKPRTPLFKSEIDKVQNLLFEVRSTDTLHASNIVEYLGIETNSPSNKVAIDWIYNNYQGDIKEFAAKAKELGRELFPDRILNIGAKYINKYDFASMVPNNEEASYTLFSNIAKKIKDRHTEKTIVELNVPEYTVEKTGAPYFTYPKKLFFEKLLAHAELPINSQQHKRNMGSVKTTQEIKDALFVYDGQGNKFKNHWIRQAKALKLPEQKLPIQPYSFGAWLGDGYVHSGDICGADHEVFKKVQSDSYEPKIETLTRQVRDFGDLNYRVVTFPSLRKALREKGFLLRAGETVKNNGTTKHIPVIYLRGSIEQRRSLLAGLMDTDGTVDPSGQLSFSTIIPELKDSVLELIRTLGYVPRVSERTPTSTKTGKTGQLAYTITFSAPPEDKIFHVSRKQKLHEERYKSNPDNSRGDGRYIVDIVEVEPVPMRCLSVDSDDRLFLVGESMVATHNSVIQRNIIFHCIQHNDRWSFLGVDLKRVELSPFRKYTKTVLAIATTLEEGVEVVKYAHDVMMERYTRMEGAGVNHFLDMVDENGTPEKAILLMVDEAYMFMSPEGNKTEEGKMRDMLHAEASQVLGDIARLGRAAGVHLVLATQRPDATVIKGELKNNLDVRIAAGRLDSTPSLMVLDSGAATMLPTDFKGRGVARIGGDLKQFQGFFADQDWIDNWLAKPQNRWREPGLFRSATDTKDKGFDSIPDIEETFTPNSTAEDINIVEDSDIDLEALAAELGLEVDDLLELASEDLQDSNDIDEEEIDLSEFIDSLEDDDLESPDEESNNNVEDNLEEFDFEKDIDDEELEKMAREFMFDDELPDDFEEAITEEEIEQLLAELSDDIIPSLVEVESDNNISKQDDASPIIIDSEGEDEFDMFKRPQREAPLKVEGPNSINDTTGDKVADSKVKEETQLDTNKISTLGNGLKIAIDEEDEPLNLDNSKVEELKTSSKDGRMLIPKKPTR
jgi:hypothetical protein